MSDSKIMDLFPTPLYIANLGSVVNSDQKDVLLQAPKIINMGNLRSEDGYILNSPMFAGLKNLIMQHVKQYVLSVHSAPGVDVYMTQSWANYTKPNEFHHKHSHPNSFISGVFYVNVKQNEDMIKFYRDSTPFFSLVREKPNNYNSSDVAILVETNDLILFPSSFVHEVPQTTSEDTRVSISFNTFIRGCIGNQESATELYLH
jgi:uncharacterized protein (TIGR02466 family)